MPLSSMSYRVPVLSSPQSTEMDQRERTVAISWIWNSVTSWQYFGILTISDLFEAVWFSYDILAEKNWINSYITESANNNSFRDTELPGRLFKLFMHP